MKKVIFIIIVIISVLLQYFFGKTRLYYYNSYNLFLLINEKNITNGELKISKNIFSSLIPQHYNLTLFISS